MGQANALLAMTADAQAVMADKSDDSDALVQQVEANSAEAIIPQTLDNLTILKAREPPHC